MKTVLVSAACDDLRYRDLRFLEEAARLGPVRVLLWTDEAVHAATGRGPKFPLAERQYFVQALRYVESVVPFDRVDPDGAPPVGDSAAHLWAVDQISDTTIRCEAARRAGLEYRVIPEAVLTPAPPTPPTPENPRSARKKVIVTGSFDWFHSGHVRFFEECSELGDLYVIVGHDGNIKLLKGEGHPLFPAVQRRYIAGAIRYVTLAVISTGHGWMDAEPECARLKPDIYAVNEDGDKPEKLAFCQKHGIEYRVLKRTPKEGLPRRQSTALRGF